MKRIRMTRSRIKATLAAGVAGLLATALSACSGGAGGHPNNVISYWLWDSSQEPGYQQTLSDQPRPVTSLVFFDFSQLVRLAERTGMTRSASFRTLRPDLETIRAVGLETTRGRADSTAEITLQIK